MMSILKEKRVSLTEMERFTLLLILGSYSHVRCLAGSCRVILWIVVFL